jgi:hypothetical protein
MSLTFIYRTGSKPKDLALTRSADSITGISFSDEPFGKKTLKLSVAILEAEGFIVRRDGGQKMTNVFTGEPYIKPNSGENLEFPEGHVSVWYPDEDYWKAWYEADLANKNKPDVSSQLLKFAKAIVLEDES